VTERVLLVVAHPVIATGIETLLKLEGDYEVRRAASIAEIANVGDWDPTVAFVDGTLLAGIAQVTIGIPAYVLSGSERDGHQLAAKLDDGRGWLRKDATGPELAHAIARVTSGPGPGDALGKMTLALVLVSCVIVLALVAYLISLALY
jgi:DNA-binding NarL/FixJ family response regulator